MRALSTQEKKKSDLLPALLNYRDQSRKGGRGGGESPTPLRKLLEKVIVRSRREEARSHDYFGRDSQRTAHVGTEGGKEGGNTTCSSRASKKEGKNTYKLKESRR